MKVLAMPVFVLGSLHPAGIFVGLGLQFEERVDVLDKVPSFAGLRVVMGQLVLLKLVYLEYEIAVLYS